MTFVRDIVVYTYDEEKQKTERFFPEEYKTPKPKSAGFFNKGEPAANGDKIKLPPYNKAKEPPLAEYAEQFEQSWLLKRVSEFVDNTIYTAFDEDNDNYYYGARFALMNAAERERFHVSHFVCFLILKQRTEEENDAKEDMQKNLLMNAEFIASQDGDFPVTLADLVENQLTFGSQLLVRFVKDAALKQRCEQTKAQLQAIKVIMLKNIQALRERGERLEELEEQTARTVDLTEQFRRNAAGLNNQNDGCCSGAGRTADSVVSVVGSVASAGYRAIVPK